MQFYQCAVNLEIDLFLDFLSARKFDAIRVWRIIRLWFVYDFIVDWGCFFSFLRDFVIFYHFTSTSPMGEVLVRRA